MARITSKEVKRRRRAKKREIIIIGFFSILIVIALLVFTLTLRSKVEANKENITKIESQIAKESERADELEQRKSFMDTNDFIEKIARERLGLVSPNEILVKPEE